MPITTRSLTALFVLLIAPPTLDPSLAVEPGGQRCFEFDKPFLSLSWP
jgi:hypothetical protein